MTRYVGTKTNAADLATQGDLTGGGGGGGMTWVGVWDSNTSYDEGEVVSTTSDFWIPHRYGLYVSLVDNNSYQPAPDQESWGEILDLTPTGWIPLDLTEEWENATGLEAAFYYAPATQRVYFRGLITNTDPNSIATLAATGLPFPDGGAYLSTGLNSQGLAPWLSIIGDWDEDPENGAELIIGTEEGVSTSISLFDLSYRIGPPPEPEE